MRQVYWQTLYCNYYIRNEAHRREHIDIRWNPYKTCLSFRIQKVIAIISITPRVLRSLLITNRRKSIKENCRSNYPIDESAFVRNKIIGGDETAKLWPITGEICVASFLFERSLQRNSQRDTIKHDRSHDAALANERFIYAGIRSLHRGYCATWETARGNDWKPAENARVSTSICMPRCSRVRGTWKWTFYDVKCLV